MKRFSYLYEIPIFFLIILGVNRVLASAIPGFIGVDPHPFWLVILLFGIRYGVTAGLSSGITATVLYLAIARYSLEPYLLEDIRFYVLPSCFILFGVLTGVVSGTYRQRLKDSQEENLKLKNELSQFEEEVKTLKEINLGLEKKIVSRMSTLATLYEGARRLDSTDPDIFWKEFLNFITKTLGADQSSLYLAENKKWVLKYYWGWESFEKHPASLEYSEGLIGLAGAQNKVLSVRDLMQNSSPQLPDLLGDALIAGPVRAGEDGKVVGVLSIQKMPFLSFNSATVNLFSFLLNWASRALGKLEETSKLRELDIIDPRYRIYSKRYFMMRGQEEYQRSITYYLPLSVGIVKIPDLSLLQDIQRKEKLAVIAELLKSQIRLMDVLAVYEESANTPFSFLLMTSSPHQSEEVVKRMLSLLQEIDPEIKIDIQLSHFSPGIKSWEELLDKART